MKNQRERHCHTHYLFFFTCNTLFFGGPLLPLFLRLVYSVVASFKEEANEQERIGKKFGNKITPQFFYEGDYRGGQCVAFVLSFPYER